MVKISVIVPVYNVEQYLEQCLTSIVNQTMKDIEIIAVNDGSTDNSLNIIKEFAGKYSNLVLLDKENGGLSSARNFGMEHAKGEFISFVDSDDFIEENMLEDLYNLAKKHEADMVVSKIKLYEGSKVTSIIPKAQYTKNILNREEAISEFLKTNITGHAWNKLYRRELFHIGHIKYPEGLLYEDIPTTLQLIAMGKKIVLTEDSFYYYRQRENAITKKISYKAVKDHFAVIEFVDNYIKKLDLDKNTKFYLKEFIVNELSYNYKLLIRYYLFTLNRDKIEDEQESLIIKRCRSINLLKYIFSLRVNKKILLKAILIDLNLYKFYVVRGENMKLKGCELMDKLSPLVSVVIPTYNRAETIEKTINSILNQTYRSIEIVIVDDCSRDNTEQIINEKFSHIENLKYIKHEKNKGGNAARNTGIENSKGKYIAFLDSDDEWLSTKIEKQINKMVKNKNCGLIYTYCANVDLNTNEIISYFGNEPGQKPFEKLLCENFIGSTSSILCTKDALMDVGMFDESLPSCQDWELYIRIASRYHIDYIGEPLLRYYIHGNSITGNCNRAIEGHIIVLERVLQLIKNCEVQLSKRNMLYYHYRKRADIYLKFRLMKDSVKYRFKSVCCNPRDIKNDLLLILSLGGKKFYDNLITAKHGIKKK